MKDDALMRAIAEKARRVAGKCLLITSTQRSIYPGLLITARHQDHWLPPHLRWENESF